MSLSRKYLGLAVLTSFILCICGEHIGGDQKNHTVQEKIEESSTFNKSSYIGLADGNPFRNCKEIFDSGVNISGIYEIQPTGSNKLINVTCDMETRGGGWTVIQRRIDGSVDFYRDWREYKFGFGDLNGEHWLGLESIYHLTAFEANLLLVELVDKDGINAYALYDSFAIGSEVEGYYLSTLKGYSGDAGDSLTYHLGQNFTTKDLDLDQSILNCAEEELGAWWYKSCYQSNLNGKLRNIFRPAAYRDKGINWLSFRDNNYFLSQTRMLVRPEY
ncbi:fibrinogen C domain-containing protein 1-B-like [Diabrotica undecimpunctata]|uniref:fibrinogen C domain-containing protein 1-B-like n=1 Tax=Diabrotica undecimpunctata TaxID=50387 RepID=UPI003B63D5F4